MTTKTIVCPSDPRYRIELDTSEIYPDDPGQGTPAMISGPEGAGTYFCVSATGELEGQPLASTILQWIEQVEEEVDDYLEEGLSGKKKC